MIEVEKRGRLNKTQLAKFKKYLNDNGKLTGRYNQLSIFIEFDNPYLGNIENAKASVNIAVSNNLLENKIECKLKSKVGNVQSTARIESAFKFEFKDITEVYDFLKIFKIETGCPRFYYREDYILDKYIISIKEKGLAPDHFEIETQVNNESEVDDAISEMTDFVNDLGINIFTEDEYKSIIMKVFKENPPIPLDSIDLSVIN